MVYELGMSERLGPVSYLAPGGSRYLMSNDAFGGRGIPVSEATAELLDSEVTAFVHRAHERAGELLRTHRAGLERLAVRLRERETLDGDELKAALADAIKSDDPVGAVTASDRRAAIRRRSEASRSFSCGRRQRSERGRRVQLLGARERARRHSGAMPHESRPPSGCKRATTQMGPYRPLTNRGDLKNFAGEAAGAVVDDVDLAARVLAEGRDADRCRSRRSTGRDRRCAPDVLRVAAADALEGADEAVSVVAVEVDALQVGHGAAAVDEAAGDRAALRG